MPQITGDLAYIEWFTDLGNPVPNLRLHQVSQSTHNHRRRASIIPIESILQSTWLWPKFPRSVDDTDWASDNVYDKAKYFYVNPFLRHYDFARFEARLSLPP